MQREVIITKKILIDFSNEQRYDIFNDFELQYYIDNLRGELKINEIDEDKEIKKEDDYDGLFIKL